MPIIYKVKRDNRKNSDHRYYGRVVIISKVNTAQLAKRIEKMCSATEGDILLVLKNLAAVMSEELQNSHAVQLDGFGTFRPAIKTVSAESMDDFSPACNIKTAKINFLPSGHKTASGKYVRNFLEDVKYQKYGVK